VKNITKLWHDLEQQPLPSIALVALFALLLLIPWPAGWIVRPLLAHYDPKILTKLSWDGVYFKPSGGLLFTNLRLDADSGLVIFAPRANIQFSWWKLAFLEPRIEEIQSAQIHIDWMIPGHTPDAKLNYAALTETHLASLLPALDSLRPILATSSIDLDLKQIWINFGADTLKLGHSAIEITPQETSWDLFLHVHNAERKPWPLPPSLKVDMSLENKRIAVLDLQACWDDGCIDANGILADSTGHSSLDMTLDEVPLAPFGNLALSKNARWNGFAYGTVHWSGRIGHPKLWKAKGSLVFTEVEFNDWPFQKDATFASFVPQFKHQILVDSLLIPAFVLQNGNARIDSITMKSPQIDAFARGHWTFPERLNFHMTGSLSKDLYTELPKLTKLALPRTQTGGGSFKATLSGTFTWQTISPDSEHYGTAFRNFFF
jgi:hypothetical protein